MIKKMDVVLQHPLTQKRFMIFGNTLYTFFIKLPVNDVDVAMCGLQMGFGNCLTKFGIFAINI